MLKKLVLLGVSLLLISVVPVYGTAVEKIEVALGYGGNSAFDAKDPLSTSELTWGDGSGAIVWKDTGADFTADDCDIAGSFSTMTDNSGGGVASALFLSGTWNITLYDYDEGLLINDWKVLSVGGTLDWYQELETDADELTGSGIVTPTSVWLDPLHPFFSSTEWGWGSDHKSGVIALTTGLSLDPADYKTDFTGNSLTLVIYADSSVIPEPATMVLLGLGAMAVLRRRRR